MLDGVKRAVFFAAHTDDEMACAGTLHRLVRQGAKIVIYPFAPAGTKEDPDGGLRALQIILPEMLAAHLTIFRKEVVIDGKSAWITPSKQLHERGQEIADQAFRFVTEFKPDLAIILSPDDENPAHAEVGRQCERVMRGRVPLVLRCQFPWNYTVGRANLYVKLEKEDMDVKRRVIEAYKSQAFRYDYSMFLDFARGHGKSVKAEACEVFEIVRAVV